MSISNAEKKPWSKWHKKLHKNLIGNENLLPAGSCLLLSISGGQDSMALLKLISDLQRIYKWQIHVWHGDHGWHNQSSKICQELKHWCHIQKLPFYSAKTNQAIISSEEKARDWRYTKLLEQAESITKDNPSLPCKHVLTGHTASDRTETFLMNLARGAHLKGLSSLKESRQLKDKVLLIRPMLRFDRKETIQICNEMNLPVWIDPSNSDVKLSRNRVRQEIIPVLEDLYSGSTIRIANLADKLSTLNDDYSELTTLAIESMKTIEGIDRAKIETLSIKVRSIIFARWIADNSGPFISSTQLLELSEKVSKGKPPGSIKLSINFEVQWNKYSIKLINP